MADEKEWAVITAAIYHAKFPHDDTLESLQRAVDALPWKDFEEEIPIASPLYALIDKETTNLWPYAVINGKRYKLQHCSISRIGTGLPFGNMIPSYIVHHGYDISMSIFGQLPNMWSKNFGIRVITGDEYQEFDMDNLETSFSFSTDKNGAIFTDITCTVKEVKTGRRDSGNTKS